MVNSRAMPKRPDVPRRIVDATLALAARDGWARLSLAAIAGEAGLPLLEVYRHFRSKSAILAAFRHRVDVETLAGAGEEGERPRDRLFDTLMRRFEVLAAHKEGLRAITRDSVADPLAALAQGPDLVRSMAWMLEASGIRSDGWRGTARAHLLAGIYLSAMRVWLADDSPDMVKTMAALDRRLRDSERWLGLGSGGGEGGAATVLQR
jgi:AcrR family transcriptional regulator